jgi:hypothetical protein
MSKNKAIKTCGECRFFESKEFICCRSGDKVAEHLAACFDFEPVTEQKPTNGDKIRQMSDKELAELLTTPPCFMCSKGDAAGECTDTWREKDCKNAILIKLKQEIKK